jgi:hypothetical protein
MANSNLIGVKVVFPKALLPRLREVSKGQFSQQLKNFIERGYLEYDDLKNFKKNYPSMLDGEKLMHGGDLFYRWVDGQLNMLRKRVEKDKAFKTAAGLGNQYLKAHGKDTNKNPTRVKITENTFKKLTETGILH